MRCYIKTRLGLHAMRSTRTSAPREGLSSWRYGGDAEVVDMESKLKAVKGLQVQKMVFDIWKEKADDLHTGEQRRSALLRNGSLPTVQAFLATGSVPPQAEQR